ncbi:MAG: MBL fold metallo-hydrolase [Magnetococcales bacterium]|nr:MBL fold metallo-hydrolase [Magnetococcales bacterium]
MAVASENEFVTEIDKDIFLVPGRKGGGCNVFVLKGTRKVALIDTGMGSDHEYLLDSLHGIGLGIEDVQMILLTHEHVDHVGGVPRLPERIVTAAHARTADKVRLNDQFSAMSGAFEGGLRQFHVDIRLEEGVSIDLGGLALRALYTPGHSSGSVSFYETERGALFTGDTIFAGGILGGIFSSGNISDYISSLERLREFRLTALYPGHGRMSTTPSEDMDRAIKGAKALMNDTRYLFDSIQVGGSFQQIVKATATYSRRAAERRTNPRHALSSEAMLHLPSADHPVGLVDISFDGVRLDRTVALDPGTNVSLSIPRIGRIEGCVVGHLKGNTRLKFIHSAANQDVLMEWMAELSRSQRRKK